MDGGVGEECASREERREKRDCSTDRSTYACITVKRISEDFARRNGIFLVDLLLHVGDYYGITS